MLRRLTSTNLRSISLIQKTFKRHYDKGDYDATVDILNENQEGMFVDTFNENGIKLSNGIRILGPCILFPKSFLAWNISGIEDVTEESLSLFTTLEPKLDILVLGVGESENLSKLKMNALTFLRKHKVNLELLPTEQALATFNFLNSERRLVAGAFIPPTYTETLLTGTDEDVNRLLANVGEGIHRPILNLVQL
ncbi:DgyrCDS6132 [Dimorphilus gyrociliatus]|uniref:NADH dehydrogenase [ubiquinone] 1 alpha subcomplex assembly factor 3 n=1 Tax=Dimorphilus gyrociliatus TaxID=2664684 RepID=A0A7I8VNQ5_9ANNE|nr:DgyrCDS6132 [Dimorphilus gyrociliatus]